MNRFFLKKELILLTLLKHENIIELNDYFIEEDSGLLCLVILACFILILKFISQVLKYFPNEHSLSCDSLEVISPADLKIYMKQLLSVRNSEKLKKKIILMFIGDRILPFRKCLSFGYKTTQYSD